MTEPLTNVEVNAELDAFTQWFKESASWRHEADDCRKGWLARAEQVKAEKIALLKRMLDEGPMFLPVLSFTYADNKWRGHIAAEIAKLEGKTNE